MEKMNLYLERHRSLDDMIEQIDAVTKKTVNEMAIRIFTDDYSVSLISPEGELPKSL